MIIPYVHHSSDYWSPFAEKVIFDGILKQIIVSPGVTTLDIRADLYSAWVWWTSLRDNSKYQYAMRFTGLDVIPGGFTGDSYFLINGWKLVLDLTKVKVSGILFSEDYTTAYFDVLLNPVYPATISALVNTVTITQNVVTGDISSVPSATQNAAAILNATAASYATPGTVGGVLTDIKDEAFGKWILDPTGKTLTLYRTDNVTVLKVFNLTTTATPVDAFLERAPA